MILGNLEKPEKEQSYQFLYPQSFAPKLTAQRQALTSFPRTEFENYMLSVCDKQRNLECLENFTEMCHCVGIQAPDWWACFMAQDMDQNAYC